MSSHEEKVYQWLLFAGKPHQRLFIKNVIVGFLIGIMILLQAGVMAFFLELWIIRHIALGKLYVPLGLFLLLSMVRSCLMLLREVLSFRLGSALRTSIRQKVFSQFETLGPRGLEAKGLGEWTCLCLEQVEKIHNFFARYMPQKIIAGLVPLCFLFFIFWGSWAAGLIFVITAPLIPCFMILVGSSAADAHNRHFKTLARLSAHFFDRICGMATLQLYMRAKQETQRIKEFADDFRVKTIQVLRLAFLSSAVLEFFTSLSIALVALFLGMSYLGKLDFGLWHHKLSLFTGLFILLMAPEFYQPLRELGGYYHDKSQAIGAAEQLVELFSKAPPKPRSFHYPKKRVYRGPVELVVAEVGVFADTANPLIKDIDFTIKAGQKMAIVGKSGAGKTTLLNTIAGFTSYSGKITFKVCAKERHDPVISYLGQQPNIINASLKDNICLNRQFEEQEIIAVLKRVSMFDFFTNLPQGLDTKLGEAGIAVSCGEAQRICLARALIEKTEILLLDEPLAALDRKNELLMQKVLDNIGTETTIIVVTHRMDQLAQVDTIAVLEAGRIVEQGSLHCLQNQKGSFYPLWQSWLRQMSSGLVKVAVLEQEI